MTKLSDNCLLKKLPEKVNLTLIIRKMGLKPRRSTTAFYSIVVYSEEEDFKRKE
ncbi:MULTISPECIES: hypothetical protein [Planktothrix]|uniref:hypothetical protein n=1 Tax=Planktothrix TaxID=54304 RepID=UPI00130525A5|nr:MULTISPECIES: hypothetical protein [Planktothrix]